MYQQGQNYLEHCELALGNHRPRTVPGNSNHIAWGPSSAERKKKWLHIYYWYSQDVNIQHCKNKQLKLPDLKEMLYNGLNIYNPIICSANNNYLFWS